MFLPLEASGSGMSGKATGGLITAAAVGLCRGAEVPATTSALITGSACSPPRPVYKARVLSGTTVAAPSRVVTRSKRRRRRQGGDAGDSGGDDDGPGDGGNWGEGWSDDGDGEQPWQLQNLWAWQVICIGSLLQAAHYLMMQSKSSNSQPRQAMQFAAVSSSGQ